MNRLFYTFIFFLALCSHVSAQSFYNGSFETNSLCACQFSLTDTQFNSKMPHVIAFGKTYVGPNMFWGKTSIQDSGCSVITVHGK